MLSVGLTWVCLLMPAALRGAESDFELHDGRSLRGTRVNEEGGVVEILVRSGGVSARLNVARDEIKAMREVAERPPTGVQVPQAEALPSTPQAVQSAGPDAIPAAAAKAPRDAPQADAPKTPPETGFQHLRVLLREALEESARDARPAPPARRGPIPQDLDQTYWDLYGPHMEGVFADNFRGLVYREGVLPRTHKHGTRALIFNSPLLPPALIPGSLPPILSP